MEWTERVAGVARMRVLVTGATGYIGSAVARALRSRGHDVVGLARTPESAEHLRAAAVEPVLGSLATLDVLRRITQEVDAVAHAAFARYGIDDMAEAGTVETAAVHAILAAAAGRPVIYTSGIGVVGETKGRAVAEDDPVDPAPGMAWRRQLELDTLAAGHGIVVRPPLVYGRAGGLVLTGLIAAAIAAGASRYVTPGDNAWPNVHVDDLGDAFALALEKASPSTILHAVSGVSTPRAVAAAIGRLIEKPSATEGLPRNQAEGVVPFPDWLTAHQQIDARRTHELLGWLPDRPSVTDDIEFGSYRALLTPEP